MSTINNTNKKNAVKEYVVYPVPQTSLYGIKLTGGGAVPETLAGLFTSKHVATDTIVSYNANNQDSARAIAE